MLKFKIYNFIIVLLLFTGGKTLCGEGPYIELQQVERRPQNQAFLINKEYNLIPFLISWRTMYKEHPIKLTNDMKNISLELTIPKVVSCEGAWQEGQKEIKQLLLTGKETRHGIAYNRYSLKLIPEVFKSRLIKNKWYYDIQVWLRPQKMIKGNIIWSLKSNDRILASGKSKLEILPEINTSIAMPKSVITGIFSPAYFYPQNNPESYAKLVKKLGFNLFGHNYYPGGKLRQNQIKNIRTLKNYGIKNLCWPASSFEQQYTYKIIKNMPEGLAYWSKWCCKQIDSKKESQDFSKVSGYFDIFGIDYEKGCSKEYPGYEDLESIKAFAKKKGISGKINAAIVKGKYSKEYAAFRNSLIAAPIKATGEMCKKVKSNIKYLVCQGSGLGSSLPYKIYDDSADYHSPMLYFNNCIDYYDKVKEMSEKLKADKLIPIPTFGWYFAGGTMRSCPRGMMLDLIGTVSCGCKGILCWPGFDKVDTGMFYGYYKALQFIAPVEDFYTRGKRTNFIKVKGIPYKKKLIDLGFKKIDASKPSWNHYLRNICWKLNGEYLVTCINFNKTVKAFTKLEAKFKEAQYIVNLQEKIYLTFKGQKMLSAKLLMKGVTVPVGPYSANCWILTNNPRRLEHCKELKLEDVNKDFILCKQEFLKSKKSDIKTGKIGNFNLKWKEIEFGGSKTVALEVSCKAQKVSFISTGGRIVNWSGRGFKNIIGCKALNSDGFGIDLLWLPSQARWSGDQNNNMTLSKTKLKNKTLELTYTGKMEQAIKNLTIEKTYRISAVKPEIRVTVKLKNFTPLPITVSYWSHNTYSSPRGNRQFFAKGKFKNLANDQYFNNMKTRDVPAKYLGPANRKAGSCSNIFGEYFPKEKLGLTFKIPKDFLQVYRWTGYTGSSTEWFSSPMTIPAGSSKSLSFSIKFKSNISAKKFKSLFIRK